MHVKKHDKSQSSPTIVNKCVWNNLRVRWQDNCGNIRTSNLPKARLRENGVGWETLWKLVSNIKTYNGHPKGKRRIADQAAIPGTAAIHCKRLKEVS